MKHLISNIRLLVLGLFLILGVNLVAQSYTLRVGSTNYNELLNKFPDRYITDTISISIINNQFAKSKIASIELESLDFLFTDTIFQETAVWGDSVHSYSDGNCQWVVWRNKYRKKLYPDAYSTFITYVKDTTKPNNKYLLWIGLAVLGVVLILCVIFRRQLLKLFSSRRTWAWPYILFMVLFVVVPLVMVGFYAFTDIDGHFTLRNFAKFFGHSAAIQTFLYSVMIAVINTLICLLIGYPAAYIMAKEDFRTPKVMAMLFILPMWINFLLRTVATVELFNMCNLPLGEGALLFGLCYDFLPFMIYPIYNTLQKMDNSLIEAAQDLGANRWQCFWKITVPLSMPGVYSGIVMVFMPTVSTFAIAELLTHNNIKLFGSLIQDYITTTDLLNYGAVLSLVLLIIIGLTSFFGNHDTGGDEKGGGLV